MQTRFQLGYAMGRDPQGKRPPLELTDPVAEDYDDRGSTTPTAPEPYASDRERGQSPEW